MKAYFLDESRSMRVLSPRMLPPEIGAGRIDAQNGDFFAAFAHEMDAQRVDERRFPRPGDARDADAAGAAGVRQDALEDALRQLAVGAPTRSPSP